MKYEVKNTFPIRLKELRIENGYTQTQLANILNIKQQSYIRYEYGTGEPSLQTLANIAAVFEVSVDFLLGLKEY